ncbi:MAG: hypothetical protein IT211_08020, partial [Armatimonadetes bacterium]|nr:hypothetical protein [Armatimonadota bacterium]
SDYWIVKLAPAATSDVTLQLESTARLSAINVVPNPVQNTAMLRIECDAEAEYVIELISAFGTVVKQQSVHLGIGEQAVHLTNMESLPAGSYEVLVSRGNKPFTRGRVVVAGK